MNSTLNFIIIILFIGAAQGILLSLVLFTLRKGNRIANRFLASMLLLFSVMIFFHSLGELEAEGLEKTSHDHFMMHSVFFLFGPLFYFYVKTLTLPQFKFRKKEWLHLLPFFISFLISSLHYPFFLEHSSYRTNYFLLIMSGLTIHLTIYLYLSIKLLRNHSLKIKESFSSIEKINLNWLRFFITGQLIIWPFAFFTELYGGGSAWWNFVWLLVSTFIYLTGYFGLRQPEIFTGNMSQESIIPDSSKRKYEKTALTPELAETYFQNLQKIMEDEKPFLDSDLTLPLLAKKVSISTHHLSQVINEKMAQNFFRFINKYRVEEAKRLLVDPEKKYFNIASIGFDAGFNSISSFNSVFKNHTDMTPSQFRKSCKPEM